MKMSEIKKFALCSCVCVCFFAAVIFTPLSGVISSALAYRLKSGFGYHGCNTADNAEFGITLLSLTGLPRVYRFADSSGTHDAVTDNISGDTDPLGISTGPVNSRSNTHLFSSEPIMSVWELYGYYRTHVIGSARNALIEEAVPYNREIPSGKFRITPRNFSGQDSENIRLLINNETSFDINNANVGEFLHLPFPIEPFDIGSQNEPVVLIVHTHATESLVDNDSFYYYPPFTAERTSDISRNIVLVGRELKETLRTYNIPVIQSQRIHDYPSFRDSYRRSLETVNEYLARYPSIRYVIDVHRDSIIAPNGEKFRPAIRVDGMETAQVMIVAGTNDGGANHPGWRDNLTFSVHLQQMMNTIYPMLARPINLRASRFNQHVVPGAIILEIGSCGSTFDEALRAARLFGECLAGLILANN